MAPGVIHVNEGGRAVTWTQGLVPNLVSHIVVMGELVSSLNHCAESASLSCAGRGRRHRKTIRVFAKVATAPMLLFCDQLSSPFDNLDLEWSRQWNLGYLDLLEASSTGLETSRTMPTVISPSFFNSAMWFS
jgi:hypothetical protein